MPTGKRNAGGEAGFTYLGVLFLVVLIGAALAGTGQLWSTTSQRAREQELLWVGSQYAQALRSYYAGSPGVAQYPQRLEELLEDRRLPNLRRHLRRLYRDPITHSHDWGLLRGVDGRITGIHSRSEQQPLKTRGFAPPWTDFEDARRYADWQFVAEPAFFDTRSSQPDAPGKALTDPP